MRKKLLSLALALALCLGLFTVPASAAGATVTEIVSPDTYEEFLSGYAAWMKGFSEGVGWHGSVWSGYGAFNAEGEVIVPPHTYSDVTEFRNGVAWGQRDGTWFAVDTSGRELFGLSSLGKDTYVTPPDNYFSDGLVQVYSSDSYPACYIDKTGKIVVPKGGAGGFHDGLARVYDAANAYYGYMDKTGEVVIPCQYNRAYDFENGLATVELNGRLMVIDTTGREADWVPEGYPFVSRVSSEIMVGQNSIPSTSIVYFDKSGRITAGPFGGYEGVIINTALRDGYIADETRNIYSFSIDGGTGKMTGTVIGTWTGDLVGNPAYIGDGFFSICSNETGRHRYGFIDYTGREIVSPKYKQIGEVGFSGGVLPVMDFTDRWGFVNTAGEEVVPCKLTGCIYQNEPGVFEVQNFNDDGRWSVVKSTGWTAPAAPTAPSTPAQPSGPSASPTSSKVLVNGKEVAFDAYTIDGSNYFKLRDLAYVLNGTEKQFEVGWDNASKTITLTSGQGYTANGSEMASSGAGSKSAAVSASKLLIDGKEVSLTAYTIDGNNYFKLRDIGQAFDFGIGWDNASKTITIDTSTGYTA